jgi:uncharacterized protein (TIGR02118 family)
MEVRAMIKVSVFYPNGVGAKFDIDYYCNQHMSMVQEKCGSSLKGVGVEQGLGADAPGAPPQFLALGHLLFDSVEAFQQAFMPHAETIVADMPNFTNTRPSVQISEVRI